MKKSIFKEKYPIFTLEIAKSESKFDSVPDILDFLYAEVEAHPKAVNIAKFDHFSHTKSINGEINPDILDAQNIILCFGLQLPRPEPLAVRPRSIGVTELADKFIINFMEAPNPIANEAMTVWVNRLIKQ